MKIVRIIGGLGNQMFQYAFYLALKKKFPSEDIFVDCSLFQTYKLHNGLELERVFGIKLNQASPRQLWKVSTPIPNQKISKLIHRYIWPRKTFIEEVVGRIDTSKVFIPGDFYYSGYWQNYEYFKDVDTEIRHVFQDKVQPNQRTASLINRLDKDENSVAIHVRRGDYLNLPEFKGICDIEYYKRAISFIIQKISDASFYIISNDIEWCKNNISGLLEGHPSCYVDWNQGDDSHFDMQIMSKCHHQIIANSSFSWWSAFLNNHSDKVILAPEKWMNKNNIARPFQMPDWILI